MTNQTMQQAAAHHFGIAWDELNAFEQAHWEAAYRAGGAALIAENERLFERKQRAAERYNRWHGRLIDSLRDSRQEAERLRAENARLQASLQGYQMGAKAEAEEADRLRGEVKALRKDAELAHAGRAKLAGAMSRLRAKHNDWTVPDQLPEEGLIWCACGDGYPANSYGAGFMDANNGVCQDCDAAMTDRARSEFNTWWERQPFKDQFADVKEQMGNVWVASREECVVELPSLLPEEEEVAGEDWALNECYNNGIKGCMVSVKAAGLGVRP